MIRWSFSILAAALTVSACSNDSLIQKQDPRRGEKSSDANPGFSLTDPQTCGTKAPESLPSDETAREEIQLADLATRLAGDGIDGWIHAAAAPFGEWVLTYRKPGDFFSHLEMAMIPADENVAKAFQSLKRSDKVHVVGQLINKTSPLGHILVSSLTMVKAFEPTTPTAPYQYKMSLEGLAAELKANDVLYATVHAQTTTGGVLVLDYKDMVLPVFVTEKNREAAKALYRGDIVGLAYSVRQTPTNPLHVEIREVNNAIVVYDHMVWCNGQQATLTGEVVLFEKSPQISMDVFALRHTDAKGMQRNWTLVNFENQDAWLALKKKIADVWDAHKETVENGRNQLINRKLKITATGMMNVVSPSQANPQLMLAGPDSLQIEILE